MKYQTGKDYSLTPIAQADQEYKQMKQKAPRATREDVVAFLRKYDGDPPAEFIENVRASSEARRLYIDVLARALSDKQYADDFFSLTSKTLDMNLPLAEALAEQVATELFGPPQALQ
jgi:hypothetical protein